MNGSPDLTLAAVKMVISLAAVLGIVWALYRVARKTVPSLQGRGGGQWIQVLAHQHLGVKRSIALVQVPGAVLVLGLGTDNVQLLTKLDDPEAVGKLAQQATASGAGVSFKTQLQRLTGFKSAGGQSVQAETAGE